jgi:hypothetical protein
MEDETWDLRDHSVGYLEMHSVSRAQPDRLNRQSLLTRPPFGKVSPNGLLYLHGRRSRFCEGAYQTLILD